MVTEFKLRPLVLHLDAGWNSQVAVNNIEQLVDGLGLEGLHGFDTRSSIIELAIRGD